MLKNLIKFSFPEIEEKVLKFWKENQIFQKSLEKNQLKTTPKSYKLKVYPPTKIFSGGAKSFIFYEGPPTANGRPGLHHILARAFKDIILRYKTMQGFYVPRRGGWDTHGLPVELEVEKQLGLKSKKEIEKFGIKEFNEKCKESVWKYKDEWEKITERIGFWLNLKEPYITYENSYIETVWWLLKQIWEKKLLYKGHKVVPWCTRCGTALSSHELAQGYKEITENSVYVKFKIRPGQKIGKDFVSDEKTYILSWTTTPWTLPGNVALAVGNKIAYAIFRIKDQGLRIKENLIAALERVSVLNLKYEMVAELKGEDLIGLEYESLFDIKKLQNEKSHKIYAADFVNTNEGTGIVHTAVMYGEDDYNLGAKIGLPKIHTVDEQGKFTKDVSELAGLYVKSKEAEEKILKYLDTKSYKLKAISYMHDYPFCWRCSTPLLYYARNAWFIAMSKLKNQLIEANQKINWVPPHIKNGRFGEWLKEVKDWTLSRERYWGTPLPIWECEKCDAKKIFASRKEISDAADKNSNNRYILLRHGEALNNTENIINYLLETSKDFPLTPEGKVKINLAAKQMIKEKIKIDVIFSSDLWRTKETAETIKKIFEIRQDVIFDKRLREGNFGIFSGKPVKDYHNYFVSDLEKFSKAPPQGENLREIAKRVSEFIFETEQKYKNKTILIVSHEYPLWMFGAVINGWSEEEAIKIKNQKHGDFLQTGEFREELLLHLPRNEFGFCDLHKPYIDEIKLVCEKCGGKMKRTSEVIDVWFDSGAMPFASAHFPFASAQNQKSKIKNQKSGNLLRKFNLNYPADYICEAMDQTRGWFYTLLAEAVLLDKQSPYKNVISLGLVLDKQGQKMSKSKGNAVNPWDIIQKYGADTIRWYFYTVNPPGEPKRFDETALMQKMREFFLLLYNCFVFYDTYADKRNLGRKKYKKAQSKPANILDKWIIARLNETTAEAEKNLENYEVGGAARKIEEFANDLSRWYIRRIRRRLQKPENRKDYIAGSETLRFVLIELSKLIAPFAPFFAEALYKSLILNPKSYNSVHLTEWPRVEDKLIDKKLFKIMDEVRKISTLALAKRADAGIKVRQPLACLKIKSLGLKIKDRQLLNILKDEVNVKEIIFDSKLKDEIEIDTRITHELWEQGILRELIRIVQGLRQDAKLNPKDIIILSVDSNEELYYILRREENLLKKEINAKTIEYGKKEKFDIELNSKIDTIPLWLGIRKP